MTELKAYPSVSKSLIAQLVHSLVFEYERIGATTTTVCYAYLPNGFRVGHGDSACVDPRNYNFDDGCKWARERAVADATNTLWQLEGYLLKVAGCTSDGLAELLAPEPSTQPGPSELSPSFRVYQGRQINRTAYEIQEGDTIVKMASNYTGGPSKSVIELDGQEFEFVHYEPVKPGDFICYLDATDIYHVRRSVMKQRNYL
jgi:hypothetical protein